MEPPKSGTAQSALDRRGLLWDLDPPLALPEQGAALADWSKGQAKTADGQCGRAWFSGGKAKGPSRVWGVQTGDMVRAVVTKGKKIGTYVGRVAIKTDGYFKITGAFGMVEGIHARYCTPIHRNDGYTYRKGKAVLPPHS
jgi:hypothetical protein